MGKLEDALAAPTDGEPITWLWAVAAASKPPPKKLPPGFEEAVIAGMGRTSTKLGEPKNGWGIGFARVANVGAQLLAICPTERLAKCVLGLAALSGIGGDEVQKVRKLKSRKAIAAVLAEFDEREAKAHSYPAMRKAMTGFADEIFPRPKAKKKAKAPALRLSIVNGRVLGPTSRGKDERRVVRPKEVTEKERAQLVGILVTAFGLKARSFGFDDIVSGESKEELLAETSQTPIEWWDVVDDAKKVRYQLWTYHVDCGSLVVAGTSKRVASIIQFSFGVEVKDRGHELARAMELAHAELRKRCPKSELARMDFSVDDD